MEQFDKCELLSNFMAARLAQCERCGAFFKTADRECNFCEPAEEEVAA